MSPNDKIKYDTLKAKQDALNARFAEQLRADSAQNESLNARFAQTQPQQTRQEPDFEKRSHPSNAAIAASGAAITGGALGALIARYAVAAPAKKIKLFKTLEKPLKDAGITSFEKFNNLMSNHNIAKKTFQEQNSSEGIPGTGIFRKPGNPAAAKTVANDIRNNVVSPTSREPIESPIIVSDGRALNVFELGLNSDVPGPFIELMKRNGMPGDDAAALYSSINANPRNRELASYLSEPRSVNDVSKLRHKYSDVNAAGQQIIETSVAPMLNLAQTHHKGIFGKAHQAFDTQPLYQAEDILKDIKQYKAPKEDRTVMAKTPAWKALDAGYGRLNVQSPMDETAVLSAGIGGPIGAGAGIQTYKALTGDYPKLPEGEDEP